MAAQCANSFGEADERTKMQRLDEAAELRHTIDLSEPFALTMIGGFTSGVTSTETMLIICPEHAAILSAGGYSKAAIRSELFLAARVPHEKISDENLELLAKRRPNWFQHSESAGRHLARRCRRRGRQVGLYSGSYRYPLTDDGDSQSSRNDQLRLRMKLRTEKE